MSVYRFELKLRDVSAKATSEWLQPLEGSILKLLLWSRWNAVYAIELIRSMRTLFHEVLPGDKELARVLVGTQILTSDRLDRVPCSAFEVIADRMRQNSPCERLLITSLVAQLRATVHTSHSASFSNSHHTRPATADGPVSAPGPAPVAIRFASRWDALLEVIGELQVASLLFEGQRKANVSWNSKDDPTGTQEDDIIARDLALSHSASEMWGHLLFVQWLAHRRPCVPFLPDGPSSSGGSSSSADTSVNSESLDSDHTGREP